MKFPVDPRIGKRHRFCSSADCRKAAKRESQQRWLNKPENRSYFKGPANAMRAKLWRASNPKKPRGQRSVHALMTPQLAAALKACGVQDLSERQLALVLGIVSHLARSSVQETIAGRIRRFMFAGYAVLRTMDSPEK